MDLNKRSDVFSTRRVSFTASTHFQRCCNVITRHSYTFDRIIMPADIVNQGVPSIKLECESPVDVSDTNLSNRNLRAYKISIELAKKQITAKTITSGRYSRGNITIALKEKLLSDVLTSVRIAYRDELLLLLITRTSAQIFRRFG